jgi:cytochrome c
MCKLTMHLALLLPALLLSAGCHKPGANAVATTGVDPARAPQLIRHYGCGTCHEIPGVGGAVGRVGPPLKSFKNRAYIAGVLSNSPDNLVRWIRSPRELAPGTAMPDMGVTEADARDIVAYLYSR